MDGKRRIEAGKKERKKERKKFEIPIKYFDIIWEGATVLAEYV